MSSKIFTPEQKANIIINRIVDDIKGRKGIGDEFDNISGEILHEMLNKWTKIALNIINNKYD